MMSTGQVAKLLGVNRTTVWRWVFDCREFYEHRTVDLPGVSLTKGGQLRFTDEAVEILRYQHKRWEEKCG